MHRSESHHSHEALRKLESALCSSADMISQINSRLQKADDQLGEERRMIAILANRLHSTEQMAQQTTNELESRHDIVGAKYVLISWVCFWNLQSTSLHLVSRIDVSREIVAQCYNSASSALMWLICCLERFFIICFVIIIHAIACI